MTDLDSLDRCHLVYDSGFKPAVSRPGIYIGLTQLSDGWAVTYQGSKTPLAWLLDFVAVPYAHPRLGVIDDGFYLELDEARAAVNAIIGNAPRQHEGHSRAGPQAMYAATLDHLDGIPVTACVAIEPAKCGQEQFSAIYAATPFHKSLYRTFGDPVPDLPHLYKHPLPEIWLGNRGEMPKMDDWFRYHHLSNVRPFMAAYLATHQPTA